MDFRHILKDVKKTSQKSIDIFSRYEIINQKEQTKDEKNSKKR